MSETDRVRVTTVVAVDPVTAFEIFTEEVDGWWKRGPRYRFVKSGVLRFEPGEGGRLVEVIDAAAGKVYEVGEILVWEPAARLVFGWRGHHFEADQRTEVEVCFEASGDGTRVTVEHRGWDALPAHHRARHGLQGGAFSAMMGLWWGDVLVSLRAFAREDRG